MAILPRLLIGQGLTLLCGFDARLLRSFKDERMVKEYGRWHLIEVCKECRAELSDDEVYFSDGICPYCGHDDDSTVLDTERIVARWVTTKKAHWFWGWFGDQPEGYWEYKR